MGDCSDDSCLWGHNWPHHIAVPQDVSVMCKQDHRRKVAIQCKIGGKAVNADLDVGLMIERNVLRH